MGGIDDIRNSLLLSTTNVSEIKLLASQIQ